ncbi:putative polypeptide N-acetylgalactosaminyltransferase 9 [Folsomia candida]|uniref:Polypeptide N-acetylgalactosaminyltransferase n=1 Tax=Folsomia candida TaxID=158441 RepID=A0A226E552_FOLCA|nr:putative polypeptide N-acetylgalactosaminyltransferase 9 [Folsomia candida]OXA52184.1 putative polypeptide N-acetylgalactosaminyltransferase 9 [Folsomia candida]
MHVLQISCFFIFSVGQAMEEISFQNSSLETDRVLDEEEFVFDQLKPAPDSGSHQILRVSLNPDDPPGEWGSPVVISNPTTEQQTLIARGYERNEFNEYVSDMIPINRKLPDFRNDWCKKPRLHLPEEQLLPTSVIICFHNEAWSVLLRSIHSILDRTPHNLLSDIILVDDFSDFEHLGEKLEKYVATLSKVRLIRAQKREGLIRARMLGASHAQGPILTFFDSHIEVTQGWFQPMSDRITKNRTAVVCPVIDQINEDTLEFKVVERSVTIVGGFSWDLMFNWVPARDEVLRSLRTPADPIPSPTMAGGLFSIHRDFFRYLGQYDEEYEIWGAENLELSFKTWMCGGTLEIIPCSHVGHIYRKKSPYAHKVKNGFSLHRNLARLAAVWLEEYASYYFSRSGTGQFDFGDVTSRLELKKKLKCRRFDWYLENVFPDMFNPKKTVAHGEVRNQGFGGVLCLDANSLTVDGINSPAIVWPCHKHGGNQFWFYSPTGEMRREELCLDYAGGPSVKMYPCHGSKGNQLWIYDDETGFLSHVHSQLCLTMDQRDSLSMERCEERITQRWKFEAYNRNFVRKLSTQVQSSLRHNQEMFTEL